MAHYESDKMIQLIQLCCWKGRTDMMQNGLVALAMKLGPDQAEEKQGKKEALNDRYIVDLLSDARKALKDGATIVRRESYINLLLGFAGFSDWDAWKSALRASGYFLSPENDHFDVSGERPCTILIPHLLEKQLNPTLTFVKKKSPIDTITYQVESLLDLAKQAMTLLEKSPVVICALPLSWKDQAVYMRNPVWGEFSGTKRILPVWIDANNEWSPFTPSLPSVKQEQSTAGIPGILTGLLFVEYYTKAESANREAEKRQSAGGNVPQINHSTIEFLVTGGTVNKSAGDQTIINHFN